MDVLSQQEIDNINFRSLLIPKYSRVVERDSAYDILTAKIEEAQSAEMQEELQNQRNASQPRTSTRQEKSTFEKVVNSSTTRSIGTTIAREVTRGLLGILGVKTTTRRTTSKKTFPWF